MAENCRVDDCQKLPLIAALKAILDAEQGFREAMGADWEGDPLSDACDEARALLYPAEGEGK